VDTRDSVLGFICEESGHFLEGSELLESFNVDFLFCHVGVELLIVLRVELPLFEFFRRSRWLLPFLLLLLPSLLLKFDIFFINFGHLVTFSLLISRLLVITSHNLCNTLLTEQEVERHVGLHGLVVLLLQLFPAFLGLLAILLLLLDPITGCKVISGPLFLSWHGEELKVMLREESFNF
jgi:hypothetical protein